MTLAILLAIVVAVCFCAKYSPWKAGSIALDLAMVICVIALLLKLL